jgi:hypothetical protein
VATNDIQVQRHREHEQRCESLIPAAAVVVLVVVLDEKDESKPSNALPPPNKLVDVESVVVVVAGAALQCAKPTYKKTMCHFQKHRTEFSCENAYVAVDGESANGSLDDMVNDGAAVTAATTAAVLALLLLPNASVRAIQREEKSTRTRVDWQNYVPPEPNESTSVDDAVVEIVRSILALAVELCFEPPLVSVLPADACIVLRSLSTFAICFWLNCC